MVRAILILMAASTAAPLLVQLPSPLPEVASGVVREDRHPVLKASSFPNHVRGIFGVAYREPVGYRPLTLDLYIPPESVQRPPAGFPLVVYVHGDGWADGDTRHSGPFVDFPGVLASLSGKGYVVASIEYRLSSEAKFPAQARDVKAAIRWLRINAAKYGIDPARAVTWGVSAGGHLAALAAVSCNADAIAPKQAAASVAPDARPDPIVSTRMSDCVQGGVAWYGVFNLATIAEQARTAKAMSRDAPEAPEWLLLGCHASKCEPRQIASASPVTYVDRADPPMLLIVGTEDTTVPHQQTLEMSEKLNAAGVKHELILFAGVGHSLLGKTPEQTREANLRALEATFRFIDQTIGKDSGANR